jgi:hypothetical protein
MELPTFETFETPSFESISAGPMETPAPPPAVEEAEVPAVHEPEEPDVPAEPAIEAPSYVEVPGTFAAPSHDAPPPQPPAPDTPGNRGLIIGYLSTVGALLLALILILVYALIIREDEPAPSTSSSSSSVVVSSSSVPQTVESVGAPASEVVDGPFTISVASTERGDTISSTVNPSLEKTAVGEFLVVYLNVGNTSGDVQEFVSALQLLNSDAGAIAPDEEATLYLGGGVVIVSPGEVLETAVVFDVPVGTVASGIVVHGVPGVAGGELPVE